MPEGEVKVDDAKICPPKRSEMKVSAVCAVLVDQAKDERVISTGSLQFYEENMIILN